MSCPHVSAPSAARVPPSGQNIYKDECTQCFHSWDDANGVDVCLTCFNTGCPGADGHASAHAARTGHALAVNLTRSLKPRRVDDGTPPPAKIARLAIAAESDAEKYDVRSTVRCYACPNHQLISEPTGLIADAVAAVVKASSASLQNEVKAWELELEACEHTVCLEQTASVKLDATTAHCGQCDLRENLWLCLGCGHLGCGRAQFGGVSGNGHALAHATSAPGHAVAVKLGTITPEGTADLYCYACDDERIDPYLADHMAHFGVNLASSIKTEKSLVELQIEQNLKFEFDMTSADGALMTPVGKPGLLGLKNLGNSCYMASVIQCLLRIPEFRERYGGDAAQAHIAQCSAASHSDCWQCQWAKIATAVAKGGCPVDPTATAPTVPGEPSAPRPDNGAVTPAMFKHMIAKGHKEFAGMKQQDASEFWSYVVKQVAQQERRQGSSPTHVFDFTQQQVIQCPSCLGINASETTASSLNIMVPDEALKRALEADKTAGSPPVTVSATDCLQQAMREHVEFECPNCGPRVLGVKTTGFKTFPKYLVLTAQRFTYDNWVPKKSSVHIQWPGAESHAAVPLHFLHTPAPPADALKLDGADPCAQEGTMAGESAPDSEELVQLLQFGVPRGKARRALRLNPGGGLDAALNWVFTSPDDVDEAEEDAIQRSLASGGKAAAVPVDEGAVANLMDMGFSRGQAVRALRETAGNVERAIEWVFSHPDATDDDGPSAAAVPPSSSEDLNRARSDVDGAATDARYVVEAFINHKGPSMLCGHYIAHVTDNESARWIMINDDRVVVNPDPVPLLGEAYVYVLRRLD